MSRVFSILALFLIFSDIARAESTCERIISLAPSVTEVIYELGLGGQLVGRTDFCRYPSEAREVDSIGGFYDVNLERLLAKRPTRVFALKENSRAVEALKRFKDDVKEVEKGFECGVTLDGFSELQEGDRLESFKIEELARTL